MQIRFTERAQKVLALSQKEAALLGHRNIGTEHILLGLLAEGEGIAAKALTELGLTFDIVQKEIESLMGANGKRVNAIHYTPRAKRVVELSQDEARKLGHTYVGTEHILLGLLREGVGVSTTIMNRLEIDLTRARQQVLQLLGASEQQGGSSRNASAPKGTPTLDSLARDLTKLVRDGKVDPFIGRDKEIERIIQVVSRRTKNKHVLIGEPG